MWTVICTIAVATLLLLRDVYRAVESSSSMMRADGDRLHRMHAVADADSIRAASA